MHSARFRELLGAVDRKLISDAYAWILEISVKKNEFWTKSL
jgi:hypothetical protein